MKKIVFFLVFILLLTSCSQNKHLDNSDRPKNIFNINVELNPDLHQLVITQQLKYYNMYDLDLSEIYFNLYPNAFQQNRGNITLLSIKANQEDVKFEYVKSNELKVTLQEALRQGNSIVFDMEYVVAIPSMESRFY